MADPFIGEIRAVGFPFAPYGWAVCNGATVNIQQSSALYSLLGTMYGGDGKVNFKLPDLQGRVIVGVGKGSGLSAYTQGQTGGNETATVSAVLAPNNLPQHTHSANISGLTSTGTVTINCNDTAASATTGDQAYFGKVNIPNGKTSTDVNAYNSTAPNKQMNNGAASFSGTVGGSISIDPAGTANPSPVCSTGDCRQPYISLLYIIAQEGIYPSHD